MTRRPASEVHVFRSIATGRWVVRAFTTTERGYRTQAKIHVAPPALDPSLRMDRPTPRAAMKAEVDDEMRPPLRRLDADAQALLFGRREPRVRRAVSADAEIHRAPLSWPACRR